MPQPLRRRLAEFEISTAQEMGWGRVKNGELLKRAEGVFDVFLTADQQLKYQQNLTGRRLAILVLSTNRWPRVKDWSARQSDCRWSGFGASTMPSNALQTADSIPWSQAGNRRWQARHPKTGRVERRRDMIRPMTSNGSALSSIVANSHQAIRFVSSAPSIHSVRRVFPQYGWKSALSSCALPKPFGASFDAGAAVHPFLAISYPGV